MWLFIEQNCSLCFLNFFSSNVPDHSSRNFSTELFSAISLDRFDLDNKNLLGFTRQVQNKLFASLFLAIVREKLLGKLFASLSLAIIFLARALSRVHQESCQPTTLPHVGQKKLLGELLRLTLPREVGENYLLRSLSSLLPKSFRKLLVSRAEGLFFFSPDA